MDDDRNDDRTPDSAAFDGLVLRVTRQTLVVLCGFMASVLGTNFATWSAVDSRQSEEFVELRQALVQQDEKREALHETLLEHVRQVHELDRLVRELRQQLSAPKSR